MFFGTQQMLKHIPADTSFTFLGIMTGSRKYDHITPALKQLKWLPVENILYLRDCVMTYKCMNKLARDYLCQKFVTRSEISNRVTRQSKQLHKPLCRTSKAQKSFLYRANSTIWNSLDDSLKSKITVKSFKLNIKKNRISHGFLTDFSRIS
jgi:hypothetical protein